MSPFTALDDLRAGRIHGAAVVVPSLARVPGRTLGDMEFESLTA